MKDVLVAELDAQRSRLIQDVLCQITGVHDWECQCRACVAADQAVSEARFSKAWAETVFCRWALRMTD